MSLLSPDPSDRPEPHPRNRTALAVLGVAAALLASFIAFWLLARRPPRELKPKPLARRVQPEMATPKPFSPTPTRREPHRPTPAPFRPAPLRVEADVPGASVFIDRQFVGNTPLDIRDLSPGQHRVNVSADGYAMHAEEVEIGAEPRTISVRFAEVRLDESLAVTHKHGVGSCEGILKASPQGLAFEATSGNDSFRVPFHDLAKFDVDYLEKILRVSRKGGRTYNFTVEGASADPLLVFRQKVEAVRKRL